jgi:hypothetical protein
MFIAILIASCSFWLLSERHDRENKKPTLAESIKLSFKGRLNFLRYHLV